MTEIYAKCILVGCRFYDHSLFRLFLMLGSFRSFVHSLVMIEIYI